MDKAIKIAAAVLGLAIAMGLAGAGYFISTTVYKGRLASDLALWQIGYSLTGGDLADVYARSRANEDALVGFLTQKGFEKADIKSDNVEVTDLLANPYRPKDASEKDRYILKGTILVRSNEVERVDRTMHELNDLIRQGIVLTANTADFEFTKLNDIKAPMLREATQNARDAAQQFANDAASKVGSIEAANQGFFSIVSRDAAQSTENPSDDAIRQGMVQESTIDKRVRVVVTLTYYLEH